MKSQFDRSVLDDIDSIDVLGIEDCQSKKAQSMQYTKHQQPELKGSEPNKNPQTYHKPEGVTFSGKFANMTTAINRPEELEEEPRDGEEQTGRGNGNKKKKAKRNKKEEEATVYKTLYPEDDLLENTDREIKRQLDVQDLPPEAHENESRTKSVLSDRFSKELKKEDIDFLETRGILGENMLEVWSDYFNAGPTCFSLKNLNQCMVLAFTSALIQDYENGEMSYLSWVRRKGDHPADAIIKLKAGDNSENQQGELLRLFAKYLEDFPQDITKCLGLALHLFSSKVLKQPLVKINPRYNSNIAISQLSKLGSDKVGKMVRIKCRTISLTTPKILVKSLEYKCGECGREFVHFMRNYIYSPPTRCEGSNCLGRTFTPDKSKSEVCIFQRFVVQEVAKESCQQEPGHHERQFMELINVEALDTIIPLVKLNKVAIITGVWKIEQTQSATFGQQKLSAKGMYDHYLEVNNIQYPEEEDCSLEERVMPFKDSKRARIVDMIIDCEFGFYLILANFCPRVEGQELIKTACMLAIVGGVAPEEFMARDLKKTKKSDCLLKARCHLLLLGERGTGRTEMLKYVESLSAESRTLLTCRQLLRGQHVRLFSADMQSGEEQRRRDASESRPSCSESWRRVLH